MVEIKGDPYAVGIDVANALGYSRPHEAITAHCKGAVSYRILTNGGEQEVKIIPEGDIYRLIVKAADQSRNTEIKARAEKFERWLFEEVIPSIRQTGSYSMERVTPLHILQQAINNMVEQEQRMKKLESTTQLIKDTVIQHPDQWRQDINKMFNRIVDKVGGRMFKELRIESYSLLEQRARVDLTRRLDNLKVRIINEGGTRTAVNNANKMDVIEADPKLREIYVPIIKEYTIKYVS
jgi:prophage antirepressor-like protein